MPPVDSGVARTRVRGSPSRTRGPCYSRSAVSSRDAERNSYLPPTPTACDARLVNYVTIVERRVNKGYLPLIEAKNVRIARTHTHASRYVLRKLLASNRRAMALARGRHLGSIGARRRRDCARKFSFLGRNARYVRRFININ